MAWSGTFFRAFQLGRALTGRGHQVTVVTTSRAARVGFRRELRHGVELIEAPDLLWGRGRTGWDLWNVINRVLGLRDRRFDAIHAFDCRPTVILPALYLARRHDLPLFLDWADWWGRGGAIGERPGRIVNLLIGGVETWFEEAFRHHARGTTVISRALQQRAMELGIPAGTICRFPNGCESDYVAPGDRAAARRELGVDQDSGILLHIGIVYPGDLALMLDALARLRRSRPDARLVMLGNPKAEIPGNVIGDRSVYAPGFVDFSVLQAWLAAADGCVIPLRDNICNRGRWPGKVNDYLAAGRPVIMPRVGDAAEIVDSARAGYTCEPSGAALGEAFGRVLADRAAAAAAGARARTLAETELNWSTIAATANDFYGRALTQTAAAVTAA